MKPSGKLVDILEFEKDPDFYSSRYKQSAGRKFEKDKVREAIREELQKFGIPEVGSDNPAADNAPDLGRVIYYFIPEYNPSALTDRESEEKEEVRVTPRRAVEIAYWYIDGLNNNPDMVKPLEDELLNRFMRYIDFRIKRKAYENALSSKSTQVPFLNEEFQMQKREYSDIDDMKQRAIELRDELKEMQVALKNLEQGDENEENSSFLNRMTGWLNKGKSERSAVDIKKNMHRKKKELRTLRTILNFPSRYKQMREWVVKRGQEFEEAVNHSEFDRVCEEIVKEKEQKRDLSDLDYEEFRNLLQGAIQVVAPAGEEQEEEDSETENDEPQQPVQTFPPYLQLKNNYTQEDIQRVFQAINNDELELGDEVPKIRTMLLSGNARGAIKEIRNILSSQ